MTRAKYSADLHFKQKCELNMYRDIVECLFNMLRGETVNLEKLNCHRDVLNYLHLSGIIESNEYDHLQDILEHVIEFFKP